MSSSFSNSLCFQWGYHSGSSTGTGTVSIAFNLTFTAFYSAAVFEKHPSTRTNSSINNQLITNSNSSMTCYINAYADGAKWIAVGKST